MFADSPLGSGDDRTSDVSEGRAYLLHQASVKEASDPAARAVDSSRLLERLASMPNLAQALLNVARNQGAPGVDGQSVQEVVSSAHVLLPKLQCALLTGTYQPGDMCIEQVNRYLRGWIGYFRLCTEEGRYFFHKFDAHIRRRLRAILLRQKKRPRHVFRHLVSRDVPERMAAGTAFCRRGLWNRSNRPGIQRAYPNAWFAERLVSLQDRWSAFNAPPERASFKQQLLFE